MSDVTQSIEALLRPEVRALKAYHVPDARGFIKLDAMENPYAWPPNLIDQWLEHLREAEPNRYPDPACQRLKQALRVAHEVPEGAEILLGNGSDELIQLLLMALKPGSTVMAPEPTFVMYRQVSLSLGLNFVGVPLRSDDFSLDTAAFCAAMAEHQPALVFMAYPNNPTANLFDRVALEQILSAAPGLVVVDEAYAAYANHSFMAALPRYPQLLVMRTLSKLGMAGLRLGFMAGDPRWIEEFDKIRLPYNINVLTQLSAEFVLDRPTEFQRQVRQILADRARLIEALQRFEHLRVFESHANFVLLKLLRDDANEVFQQLKAQGVLIKNLHPNGGLLTNCLRITVGKPEENQRFLEAFAHAIGQTAPA